MKLFWIIFCFVFLLFITSLTYSISADELTTIYPDREYYCVCGDRFTSGDNLIVENSANVVVDCQDNTLGHGGAYYAINAPRGILIRDAVNVTVANCRFEKLEHCVDCPFPIHYSPYAYNALITGCSDNIEFIDCEFDYDVKVENTGKNKFENCSFEEEGDLDRVIHIYNTAQTRFTNDSSFNLHRILIHSGNITFEDSNISVGNSVTNNIKQ